MQRRIMPFVWRILLSDTGKTDWLLLMVSKPEYKRMNIARILFGCLLLLIVNSTYAFSGGDGTPENPYQISTPQDLEAVNNDLAASYILINDIDLTGITYTAAVISAHDGSDWQFTGSKFMGLFDGNSFAVRNLTVVEDTSVSWDFYKGLFGCLGSESEISDLGIENCSVNGNEDSYYIGGLCGYNDFGKISYCYTSGSITGSEMIGGLAGCNDGSLEKCYSSCDIAGVGSLGGLVGYNLQGSLIECNASGQVNGTAYNVGGLVGVNENVIDNCHAIGDVDGDWAIGGLIGINMGSVANSYAAGVISGHEMVAGLSGRNLEGSIVDSYATGEVSGSLYIGGLVANNEDGVVTGCYADCKVSGDWDVGGLIGVTSGCVTNCYSVGGVTGAGSRIGGLVGYSSGSVINSHSTSIVVGDGDVGGLMGFNGGSITNCYSTGNITGSYDGVGGLVGSNSSSITRCYATGNANSMSDKIGGLVGINGGIIANCHARGDVSGSDESLYIGGFCGYNTYGSIDNCYSIGSVSGGDAAMYLGGLCGYNYMGDISNSFWNTQTSNMVLGYNLDSDDLGVVTNVLGKTILQMQELDTFIDAGWDFVGESDNGEMEVWYLSDGDYPRLYWAADKGDVNYDGFVDELDLSVIISQWLNGAAENQRLVADIDESGVVDILDYVILAAQW
ncbi:MAG: GLUG motif-containing protein [Sedimentisphaeraceae bacterium JB056]